MRDGGTGKEAVTNPTVCGSSPASSPVYWGMIHGHTEMSDGTGTLEQYFHQLRDEVALDFAIQCSPDHPLIEEHPEWFRFRPDGTIKYAENPPKKYQDIVNVDWESED